MSSNENMIVKANEGILTDSWIAGTSSKALRTIFKHTNLETIDIKKVCEAIFSVIRKQKDSENLQGSLRNCIKFSDLSRLYFGTIRIHSQQVQNLLVLARTFVERSCFTKHAILSQRRTQLYITKKTRSVHRKIGGYTKLNAPESVPTIRNGATPVSECIHTEAHSVALSNFTMREPDRDKEISELDEIMDFGFSDINTTTDPLYEIFNSANTPTKNNDDLLDKESTKNQSINPETPSTHDQSIQKTDLGIEMTLSSASDTKQWFNVDNASSSALHTQVESPCADVPPESSVVDSVAMENNAAVGLNTTSKCNLQTLPVDKSVRLTDQELLCSWNQYPKKQCLAVKKTKSITKYKTKRNIKLDLQLKRRCSIKVDNIKSKENSNLNILSERVLNEIGNSNNKQHANINTDLEDALVPSCNRRKRKSTKETHTKENNAIDCIEANALLTADINNCEDINNLSDSSDKENCKRICLSDIQILDLPGSNKQILSRNSISLRLLNAFQELKTEYVDGKEFIAKAKTRKDAAFTFSTLLELAKARIIVMTKDENTCQLEKISLGPCFEKLTFFK